MILIDDNLGQSKIKYGSLVLVILEYGMFKCNFSGTFNFLTVSVDFC